MIVSTRASLFSFSKYLLQNYSHPSHINTLAHTTHCFKIMVSSIALTLFAIAQLGKALPNASSAFQVTALNTFEPSGRPENSNIYRVGFSVTDPSDSSTATCTTEWDYSVATTGYPSSYLANCTDPLYAFKFVDYKNYYDFKLDVKHIT
jgi:hypothetical protein